MKIYPKVNGYWNFGVKNAVTTTLVHTFLRVKRLSTVLKEMVNTLNTLFFISFLALLQISRKADFNY